MSTPSIPSNIVITQGNGSVYISWSLVSGAAGYIVQRSTDQLTYMTVATLTTALQYLDLSVVVGTPYFYQVAATNGSGAGLYSIPVSATPATAGEMSLGQLRLMSQQRADRVNSNFVTTAEWNQNLNQSLFELYDILIDAYEDYFLDLPPVQFVTNGSSQTYPTPDGINTGFVNGLTGAPLGYVAPPFYKAWGLDLAANTSPTGWVTIAKFNPLDRNKYFYPNTQSTIYGVFNMQYRVLGLSTIMFIPVPSSNQYIRLWYYPRMKMLLADNDVTQYLGVSGWLEYVIVDGAIKALRKEQGWSTDALERDKELLRQRIMAAAKNKDAGRPDTIQNSRSNPGGDGWGGGGSWFPGGGY